MKIVDIGKLRQRFIEEERRLHSVETFGEKREGLSTLESAICEDVIQKGYLLAYREFCESDSRATWYRYKKRLKLRGIYIEALQGSAKTERVEPIIFKLRKAA